MNYILLSESTNLFEQINLWNIVFVMINVLILFFGLKHFMYKPVMKFINKRRESIVAITEENEKLTAEIAASQQNAEKVMDLARQEAQKLNEEAVKFAKEKKEEMLVEARTRKEEIVQRGKLEAEKEKQKVMEDVKNTVATLSTSLAEKILEKEIDQKTNSEIVEKYLDQLEKELK